MTHRFFIPAQCIKPPTVYIAGDTAQQIKSVLRMQPDDELIVLDNSGTEWQVRLTQINKDNISGQIINQQTGQGEPKLYLTLFQGTLKAKKFEWVLQKGTELGVSCFVPTICQRSIVRKAQVLVKKQTRWQHIIQEAAEQSGRSKLPRLEAAMSLAEALKHSPPSQLKLIPWEEATETSLKTALNTSPIDTIALFIGPEGGFTSAEADLAHQNGGQLIKLGPRILRAETAGLATTAAILYELNEWG